MICPKCGFVAIRIPRTWWDKLIGRQARWECNLCYRRFTAEDDAADHAG